MNPLDDLDGKLRKLLKTGHPARPFVCSGLPLGCEVAVVGANPASCTSFWDYWNPAVGFDREGWRRAYAKDPANDAKVSRHHIDALVEALLPNRTIELNAYPYIARRFSDLKPYLKSAAVLEFMLSTVAPRVVYASGHVASNVVAKLFAVDRHRLDFQTGRTPSFECRVLLDPEHFMDWPEPEVNQRCHQLSARIRGQL